MITRESNVMMECLCFFEKECYPQEFTTMVIAGVYIPCSANAKDVLCELYRAIGKLQNTQWRTFYCCSRFLPYKSQVSAPKIPSACGLCNERGKHSGSCLHKQSQHVPCGTLCPQLRYSDNISVMLIPVYRPRTRHSKPVLKQVKTRPAAAISTLQDCFEDPDFHMFSEAATDDCKVVKAESRWQSSHKHSAGQIVSGHQQAKCAYGKRIHSHF